jgi:hypothetical protein
VTHRKKFARSVLFVLQYTRGGQRWTDKDVLRENHRGSAIRQSLLQRAYQAIEYRAEVCARFVTDSGTFRITPEHSSRQRLSARRAHCAAAGHGRLGR